MGIAPGQIHGEKEWQRDLSLTKSKPWPAIQSFWVRTTLLWTLDRMEGGPVRSAVH